MLYKLCDALAGAMTAPFVLTALGYDKATYAAIVKGLGLAALLIGGFAGGAVARALPLATALWLGAILQMVSNLAFVWLWYQPPSAWALAVAMVLENFTGAIGTVIFIAYISALCRNPLHTATQYALLTALASAGRTVFASGTGFVVDAIGWPAFFVDNGAGGAAVAGAAGLAAAARAFRASRCGAEREQITSWEQGGKAELCARSCGIVLYNRLCICSIETELEDDGRWIAEIPQLPGVLAYGATADEASSAKARFSRCACSLERLEHGEARPWRSASRSPLHDRLAVGQGAARHTGLKPGDL